MAQLRTAYSATIAAPAARVYAILTDYRGAHHRILPPKFFTGVEVVNGGQGAGTELKVSARFFGKETTLRMIVAEPEAGRVLTETDMDTGLVTTFTVEAESETATRVTIGTVWTSQSGFAGFLEKLLMPGQMRRMYREELALLDTVARF